MAERGSEMTEWNDGRLDDLSERVGRIEKKMDDGFVHIDDKFVHVDAKFERLERKMDDGFARMDAKFDEFFFRMDAKFDAVNERFDAVNQRFEGLHQMLFRSAWALVIGLLSMFSVLIGVVLTQS